VRPSSHLTGTDLRVAAEDPGTTNQDPAPGDVVRGRYAYRIVRRLGRGGFSSVFLADCLSRVPNGPPAQVAIKVLKPDADVKNLEARMKRELSSLLAIAHPRIPVVYDWSPTGAWPFVSMPYYPRGSLHDVLATTGALEEEEVWRLLADLLGALVAAHQASVLHLDIKPANVLVDADSSYALTDFGISQGARMYRGPLPTIGTGTRGYQAPEQRWVEPDKFDMRTDLYSLGATAWAATTGINLSSRKAIDLMSEGPEQTFGLPPVTKFRQYCSAELRQLIMSMLYQDQRLRPGSAAEVLREVEAHLHGRPRPSHQDGVEVDEAEAEQIIGGLVDPLWAHVFRNSSRRGILAFEHGEHLCREGEFSHYTYILLRGRIRILKGGKHLATESREGTFLGEVATLTGESRTASLQAEGKAWVRVMNASQLERFVTTNPAIGVRLIRSMAERLVRS
jgi:serine/threonine protein kinase